MKKQNDFGKDELGNDKPVIMAADEPRKVSAVFFDEKTGTITLKIASEEEIAEAERLKNQPKV